MSTKLKMPLWFFRKFFACSQKRRNIFQHGELLKETFLTGADWLLCQQCQTYDCHQKKNTKHFERFTISSQDRCRAMYMFPTLDFNGSISIFMDIMYYQFFHFIAVAIKSGFYVKSHTIFFLEILYSNTLPITTKMCRNKINFSRNIIVIPFK